MPVTEELEELTAAAPVHRPASDDAASFLDDHEHPGYRVFLKRQRKRKKKKMKSAPSPLTLLRVAPDSTGRYWQIAVSPLSPRNTGVCTANNAYKAACAEKREDKYSPTA